ncbi:MAG: hypothetical protein ACEPOW_12205 [Bacteroidales bacterium]
MKKIYYHSLTFSLSFLLLAVSCNKKNDSSAPQKLKLDNPMEWQNKKGMPDPANEDAPTLIPSQQLLAKTHEYVLNKQRKDNLKWMEMNHNQITYNCAKKLGLDEARCKIMGEASEMPDFTQYGIQNGFNQQWSHAFMFSYSGKWIWGDADDDLNDNIDGQDSKHEGYNNKSAKHYYEMGVRDLGDWYVGYATHFMEDVCQPLHSTFILPWPSIATRHFDYEEWVDNNWTKGHRFVEDVKNVNPDEYYNIIDLKKAIYDAASYSSVFKNKLSKDLWNAYGKSGYPTETGTGNAQAVENTRIMIREATKWTGGVIQYSLNKYNQW